MAIVDMFKRKKSASPAHREGPKPKASVAQAAEAKGAAAERGARKIAGVLIAPHLTEKSTDANARGWYVFRVSPLASKPVIKRAVEDRYGVSVERVRVLAARSKAVRIGRVVGRSPGFKKAMVKIREGQSIELA